MGKKFTFRLDPLLKLREHVEEKRKAALAAVLGRVNEQTARARRYDDLMRDEHRRLRVAGGLVGTLDMNRLAHHRRYVNTLIRAMIETLTERAVSVQQSGRARAELAEAVKQRKVLANLRERRLTDHRRRADRAEAHALDELAAQFDRRRKEAAP